jgi:hypothetical protein
MRDIARTSALPKKRQRGRILMQEAFVLRSFALEPSAASALLHTSVRVAVSVLVMACGAEDDPAVTAPTGQHDAAPIGATPHDASATEASAEAERAQDGGPSPDASNTSANADAGVLTQGGCSLGEASSLASDQSLDLFGSITYFAKGKVLPAGHYRVAYVDGCMKFNPVLPWSVNNAASSGWWLVGASSSERVVGLPGNTDNGFLSNLSGFAECVAKNQALPPKEFNFVGGKLGIWLDDGPYTDNQAGEGGRNPTWRLTLLVDACPPELL